VDFVLQPRSTDPLRSDLAQRAGSDKILWLLRRAAGVRHILTTESALPFGRLTAPGKRSVVGMRLTEPEARFAPTTSGTAATTAEW
jgi:hypothetical protein